MAAVGQRAICQASTALEAVVQKGETMRYNQTATKEVVDPRDLNRDGTLSAGELFLSTVIVMVCLTLAMASLAVGGWVVLFTDSRGPFKLVIGMVCLILLVSGVFGIWRQLRYEFMFHWARSDRLRRELQEAEDRQRTSSLQDEIKERLNQADIDETVELILSRCYAGKPWSRDKMREVPENRWNAANEALKSCGLRKGKGDIQADDYATAWRTYIQWRRRSMRVHIGSDGNQIRM